MAYYSCAGLYIQYALQPSFDFTLCDRLGLGSAGSTSAEATIASLFSTGAERSASSPFNPFPNAVPSSSKDEITLK